MDMETEDQRHAAFHLTGKRPESGLDTLEELDLRPVLFARYRDLTRLRYDFPLVLVRGGGGACMKALAAIVDGVLREAADGADGERLAQHLLRLELQIRALAAEGVAGSLSTLWEMAAARLASRPGDPLHESLRRARAALKLDGEVVDCDAAMPARAMRHAWNEVQARKADRFREVVGRLRLRLSNILRADFVRSPAGRSAETLEASLGALHAGDFDFTAMSRLLIEASPAAALSNSRRRRIGDLLSVLDGQRFFPAAAGDGAARHGEPPYSFVFGDCTAALEAYRARSAEVAAFAKAIAMAELEVEGEYDEARHDSLFREFGRDGLDPDDAALFPDYFVGMNDSRLGPIENAALMEILSAGLPMKVLVQTDDILGESRFGDGRLGFGGRGRRLAHMAIGLSDVFVLQTCSSHLLRFHDQILSGLAYPGAALFSVFSGATAATEGLPPYLTAAAAMESRAFPAFVYDPSAGPDWASRFDLRANPQPASDWPVHGFAFEDETHQKVTEDVAVTLVDFAACDRRYARRFARIPRANWNGNMAPVVDCLAHEAKGPSAKVPCLLMVDSGNVLQKVIVDDKLLREARRCREMWRSLQELGGINNSHVAKELARAEKSREDREAAARTDKPKQAAENGVPGRTAAETPAAAAPTPPPADAQPERSPDEAYIETPRCTTCNECTKINAKMFAYDGNKQAYIADLAAGTYAQLVEAAESCQVAIVHPGKPRDPNEPGLDELRKRAEAFA